MAKELFIEIRPGEGGEDARLLVARQAAIYERYAANNGLSCRCEPGVAFVTLVLSGDPHKLQGLHHEAGGHRWQRIPPTEKRGRVHTSTVTVAVLSEQRTEFVLKDQDLRIEWYSGTGAGGQHRNKHQNSCRLTHVPSGVVATAQCRSRENSLAEAKAVLLRRLMETHEQKQTDHTAGKRAVQVGSGMRGDKIRTYREQDNVVTDAKPSNKLPLSVVERGHVDQFWVF